MPVQHRADRGISPWDCQLLQSFWVSVVVFETGAVYDTDTKTVFPAPAGGGQYVLTLGCGFICRIVGLTNTSTPLWIILLISLVDRTQPYRAKVWFRLYIVDFSTYIDNHQSTSRCSFRPSTKPIFQSTKVPYSRDSPIKYIPVVNGHS